MNAVYRSQQTSNVTSLSNVDLESSLGGDQSFRLAQAVAVTTTINLRSSTPATQRALQDYLEAQSIPFSFDRSANPDKLTVRVVEHQAAGVLSKLYGLGSYDDAFQIHRNLLQRGLAENYHYGSLANAEVEQKFCSGERFFVSRVLREPSYAFASGRREGAVRYSITSKGTSFDVIIPEESLSHSSLLRSLAELVDETSPMALREIKAIRLDIGDGQRVSYKSDTTGEVLDGHALANVNTERGVINFFQNSPSKPWDSTLKRDIYFHEVAHLLADEFFHFFKTKGHPEATGITSDPADPWSIWDYAIKRDSLNVPDHGGRNPRIEDFANSVEQWIENRDSFTAKYPKRAALIRAFSDNIIDKNHRLYCSDRPPIPF